jgi:hypothetical protein
MSTPTQPSAVAAVIQPPTVAASPQGFFDDMEALKLSLQDACGSP